jgi:anti-sigma factor RsiW
MNCPMEDRNSETLVAYAAGALDPDTAATIERHLSACPACRAMAAEQAALWKTLDTWEAQPVSADFDQRLYRRIRDEVRLTWWERLSRPFRPMPLRQALPLGATACLLIIASFLVQQPAKLAPDQPRGEVVRADQVERTLDDLELLRQFGTANQAEAPHSDTM